MSVLLTVLYVVLVTYSAVAALYMLLVVIGSWLYRAPAGRSAGAPPNIAVIIPAHNEEHGITATIDALLSTDYPADCLDVFVVADNCDDATAARAAHAGANVWVRYDLENRGKGQALDWALTQHKHALARFDLIAFIDADMHIDKAFFNAAANWFSARDISVVQGQYIMSRENMSWLRAMAFASFSYVNHVRPAGRCKWGGSAGLKGGGMIFRRELILEIGWPAQSIIEDVELGMRLSLDGVQVVYAPDAVVTSSVPTGVREASVQQSRWEGGKRALFSRMFVPLLQRSLRRPTMLSVDALLDLLIPPLSMLVLLIFFSFGIAIAAGKSVVPFVIVLIIFAMAVITGLIQLRAPAGVWWRLVLAPLFVVWKIFLIVSLLIARRAQGWHRTPRTND